eukprot:TRINITY_DN4088_c0_g1_i1.p1 TRINITY_DN4088_c0_g1~~TRINITY_DN4088_c0_g1_i1.p1  ORF type:complete len:235 (+),score=93.09 TRINITY_DN4088_c0_g1_i1:64-768(+)
MAQLLPRRLKKALDNKTFKGFVNSKLQEHGFTNDNTLFGYSSCPDEVTRRLDEDLFTSDYGVGFAFGGLGGIPFVGKTGFGAFSHHIPDDGNALIIYASHTGICEGDVGVTLRPGMSHKSTCCGSACAALKTVEVDAIVDPSEFQQAHVTKIVRNSFDRIQKAEDAQMELAFVMHDAIKEHIEDIVDIDAIPGKLALLGGIQITADDGDLFLPLSFELRSKEDETVNLLMEDPK